MQYIRQNSTVTVAIGLAVDWRDGKTLLTETPQLSDLACTIYKNGVPTEKTLDSNLVVDTNGVLLLTLTSADTDTLGRLDIVLRNDVIDGFSTDVIVPRSAQFWVLENDAPLPYSTPYTFDYNGAQDILNQGLNWLEQQLTASSAVAVEYRRGNDILILAAVMGKTDVEFEDASGMSVGGVVMDFLINSASIGFQPEAGDTIVVGGKNYEVRNIAGIGCWRWTGPNQKTYRIHTQEIG